MRRSWKSGEDADLCSSVLQEACVLLEALPPGSLFQTKSYPSLWVDSIDKVTSFLATIVTRCVYGYVCRFVRMGVSRIKMGVSSIYIYMFLCVQR